MTTKQSGPPGVPSSTGPTPVPSSTHASVKVLWCAIGLWLLVNAWLITSRIYSPDEFEALHQGWLLFVGDVQFRDFNSNHPPLYFELLRLLNVVSTDPLTLILLGRLLSFVLSGCALALVYVIAQRSYGKAAARYSVALYCTSATFWVWSLEARTDVLMVPLWLAAMALLVGAGKATRTWRLVGIGLCLGTAFCVNQKAVLHAVPLCIYLAVGGPRLAWRWTGLFLAGAAGMVPGLVVAARAAHLGSLAGLWKDLFLGSGELASLDPYRLYRAITAFQFLNWDLGLAAIGMFGLVRALKRLPGATRNQVFVTGTTAWMIFTFFLTPGPFGYYLLSILPLLVIPAGDWLNDVQSKLVPSRSMRAVATGFIAIYMAFPMLWLSRQLVPTNSYQRRVIRLASSIVGPDEAVFDLSGFLVSRRDAYPFHTRLSDEERAARGEPLSPAVAELRRARCRFMIRGGRVLNWPNEADREVLERSFVRLWGPLYAVGWDSMEDVGAEGSEMELWYDGTYETNTNGLMIDGRPVSGAFQLAAGRHRVNVTGRPQRVWLRDASYRSKVDLPPGEPDVSRFLYTRWMGDNTLYLSRFLYPRLARDATVLGQPSDTSVLGSGHHHEQRAAERETETADELLFGTRDSVEGSVHHRIGHSLRG